jgi:hypothetical protein
MSFMTSVTFPTLKTMRSSSTSLCSISYLRSAVRSFIWFRTADPKKLNPKEDELQENQSLTENSSLDHSFLSFSYSISGNFIMEPTVN